MTVKRSDLQSTFFDKRTLFIRGEHSTLIRDEDMPPIRKLFPRTEFANPGADTGSMRINRGVPP